MNPSRVALRISPQAERAVRAGHPWVYAEAIRHQRHAGSAGDLAVIYDGRNRFLAVGLYDPASPLRVRILQRGQSASIGPAWIAERLQAALARRAPLTGSADTTGYRLVHGENDGLPGAVVDWYDRTLVLKLYTAAWAAHLDGLVEALRVVRPERMVLRLSRAVQSQANTLRDGALLAGKPLRGPVGFLEQGLEFTVDPRAGHKTGFYLDQRDNRRRVETLAAGRRVLDAFAYTGAFSVYAARGGASEVTSVDISAPALREVQRHFELNRRYPAVAAARHRAVRGDAMEALERLRRSGRRYEMVILDPPAFAHSKVQVPAALRGYARLTRLGVALVSQGGVLVQSSCSSHVRADAFFRVVRRAAASAGRRLRELERTGHPLDHPAAFPEGAYLKCFFATVSDGQRAVRRAPARLS